MSEIGYEGSEDLLSSWQYLLWTPSFILDKTVEDISEADLLCEAF
jgi:hypothetical protein